MRRCRCLRGGPASGPVPVRPVFAVGVGSSAGLDVYGSSQANLQIMLDDEDSVASLDKAAALWGCDAAQRKALEDALLWRCVELFR